MQVETIAGKVGVNGHEDGKCLDARFKSVCGLVADLKGTLYVFDSSMLRKITPNGDVITIAGCNKEGLKDGKALEAELGSVYSLTMDLPRETIYFVDSTYNCIRKLKDGIVTTLAGKNKGFKDGQGLEARFSDPCGITCDEEGNIYVSDSENNSIRMISPSGNVKTLCGNSTKGKLDGNSETARFNSPLKYPIEMDFYGLLIIIIVL